MADDPLGAANLGEATGVSKTVVKALVERPAYVLLYAVCLLLFAISVYFLFYISVKDTSTAVKLAPIAAMVLAVVIALVAVLYLEPRQKTHTSGALPSPGDAPAPSAVPEPSDEHSAVAARVETGLRKGFALAPPAIQEQLRRMSSEWAEIAKNAGEGRLRASGARYNQILVGMYAAAESTVFSTSIRDFLVGWGDTELGEAILKAHHQSTAAVTRVFVFETLDEVDATSRAVMLRQQESGRIAVRVYVNKLDPFFHLSPHEGRRDFTIIDDAVCAFTEEYGPGKFTADWYFGDHDQLQRVLQIRKDLTQYSLPLAEWLEKYGSVDAARADA